MFVLQHFHTRGPAVLGLAWYSLTPGSAVATVLLWICCISTQSRTHHLFWMTCPEAVHPFISWLKVKAKAQKTFCIQYHTRNRHTCWQINNRTDKLCRKNEGQTQRLVRKYMTYICLATYVNKLSISSLCLNSVESFPCNRTNLHNVNQG